MSPPLQQCRARSPSVRGPAPIRRHAYSRRCYSLQPWRVLFSSWPWSHFTDIFAVPAAGACFLDYLGGEHSGLGAAASTAACGSIMTPNNRWSPTARFLRVLLIGCVIGAGFVLVVKLVEWSGPKPPRPPLLRNVSAGGGWWGACPPESEEEAREREGRPLAISPELDRRLSQSFPPGSSETKLVATLRSQGFELMSACKSDPSIHVALFMQHGHGLLSYAMTANVYWKVDQANNIQWTKGFVRYVGL